VTQSYGFVFGVDLDGVCADFVGGLRPLAAEWLGRDLEELPLEVSYGFPEWGLGGGQYEKLHRWAVLKRDLFLNLPLIPGAAPTLRRLSEEGIHIRIITHRLYVERTHQEATGQTVEWLDRFDIPYWDLCFMRDKTAVGADLYIEDTPRNVHELSSGGADVILFSASSNREFVFSPRADNWDEVYRLVASYAEKWRSRQRSSENEQT
jgi:5'(3')-deoxyribonucleotidase